MGAWGSGECLRCLCAVQERWVSNESKCEICYDFLTVQEYATKEDRKNKFSNLRDEEDGEIVPAIMTELQRGANSELSRKFPSIELSHKHIKPAPSAGRARHWWKMGTW